MKKINFTTNCWAFKTQEGKLLTVGQTGLVQDPLGQYEASDPYLLTTREEARSVNKNFFCGNHKVVKVSVTVKEAA